MRIAFVQQAYREQFGIMYLSAMLKEAGHSVSVFIYSRPGQIEEAIKFHADLYAFSSCTPTWEEDKKTILYIKTQTGVKTIVGGPHATFNPEETLNTPGVDFICRGEGYEAIVELANNIQNTLAYSVIDLNIRNIGYKVYNDFIPGMKTPYRIILNELRPIYDINKLPMPDYWVYYGKFYDLREKPTKQVYIVRGCPYQCAFCYNPVLNSLYAGDNRVLQYMGIEKAIAEIKHLDKKYGFKWLQFISDTMNLDARWFMAFLRRYKEEIGKPYLCNVRANMVTEELVRTMKETGCDRVDFGVEHGDDKIRNVVLKRNMSSETIIAAGKLFRKYGIRVQTTNIMGLPDETLSSAIKTVKINQAFRPEIAKCCILQPFKGTSIYQYAQDRDLLQNMELQSGTTFQSIFDGRGGVTKIKIKDEKQIIRLSYLLDYFVHRPWLNPLIRLIVNLPFDSLYKKAYNKSFKKIENKYQ